MDTKLATTKVRLESWTNIIRERSASGQNVKVWCKENNIPEGQYYYWLRRVKEAALTASGSRTVEICMPGQESSVTEPVTTSDHTATSAENSILIQIRDITISVGSSVSEDLLTRAIRAARNA